MAKRECKPHPGWKRSRECVIRLSGSATCFSGTRTPAMRWTPRVECHSCVRANGAARNKSQGEKPSEIGGWRISFLYRFSPHDPKDETWGARSPAND
jgi:hypothetical protein